MTSEEIINKVNALALRREEHWHDDQKLRHFTRRLDSVDDDVDIGIRCYPD